MTSASELFYRRRSRVDRNDSELGFGSPSPSIDRSLHNHNIHSHRRSRHNHHHHHHLRVRDVDDCDPIRRSPRHPCHREQESSSARVDQSGAGNYSSNMGGGSSSSRANRLQIGQIGQNDQLPGSVLLARERLVERLRGVSLNGNRLLQYDLVVTGSSHGNSLSTKQGQSNRVSLGISWDEFPFGDDFRLVDAGDWETETSGEWLAGATPLADSSTQTDLSLPIPHFNKRPPALSRKEVNCLHREIFTTKERGDPSVLVTECSICLDRFEDGDLLVSLPCGHKFHSACLDPWVRICGDCPNCRAGIVFDRHRTLK